MAPSPSLSRKTSGSRRSVQSALRNRIAAAYKVGYEPSEHPDRPADKTRTQLDGPPIEFTDRRNSSEQQAIIDNRHEPGDRP